MHIIYEWTVDGRANIDKARAQGTLGEFAKVPVRITKLEVREHDSHLNDLGTLVLTLEPEVHVKDAVELAANPNCPDCKGRGFVRYTYAQDESRTAACVACFPNDRRAIVESERWAAHVKAIQP
jgi:hypothetical protein